MLFLYVVSYRPFYAIFTLVPMVCPYFVKRYGSEPFILSSKIYCLVYSMQQLFFAIWYNLSLILNNFSHEVKYMLNFPLLGYKKVIQS